MWKTFNVMYWLLIAAASTGAAMALDTGDLMISSNRLTDDYLLITERPDYSYYFDTENFRIHYETEGENAVYHPDEDINPIDGVPDYINRMAEYLEHARNVYINELGYDAPPPDDGMGGDDRYDIYVGTTTGLVIPEYPSNYYPERWAFVSFAFIGNDLRNQYHPDDPYPFMMATCAHEYFHAVQMAYRAFTDDPTPWWFELTANWAEERAFDDLNEVYHYVGDYFLKINRSIYKTGGSHMYGAWVLAEYFSQNYENDIIKKIFEKLIHFDNAMDAILATFTQPGLDFDREFSKFGIWNYFTYYNYQPGFFDEGNDFPATVPIARAHYYYPTNWIEAPIKVENLGMAYIYFANPGYNKCDLKIEFMADGQYPIGIGLAAIYVDRPIQVSTYDMDPGQNTELSINEFNNCQGAIMCVNWRYQNDCPDDSASYEYSARLDSIITDITATSSEPPRDFELKGNYPNPFNLSSNIIFYWNSEPADYKMGIYDIKGALVQKLTGVAVAGENAVTWTAHSGAASGIYLYRLEVGDKAADGRMMLLK